MVTTVRFKSGDVRRAPRHRVWAIYAAVASCLILLLPLVLSQFDYSFLQLLLASILLSVCLFPTAHYFANLETGQPAFAVLCISYAVQFAIPVFTLEPAMDVVSGTVYLDDADVIAALVLSILGVGALQLGYYHFKANRITKLIPIVNLSLNEKRASVYCVMIFALLFSVSSSQEFLPPELANIVAQLSALAALLQNQLLVVIGVFGWIVYSGRGAVWHKILLYGIVGLTVFRGISGGFLEQAILPVVVLFLTRWLYVKRLPLKIMFVVAAIIIFLSPVKGRFRAEVWYSPGSADTSSSVERAFLWFGQASEYWTETLSGQRGFAESTVSAASRTDLIHQLAYIYMMTPSVIPYEYGSTYSYFAVAIIPRFIWPEKPIAGVVNKNFSVDYGITTAEIAENTSFGMSLLGEGYINFGIVGVVLVMAIQGLLLSLLEHIFGGYRSGAGGQAVFLAFYVFFFNGVGSSAEILFGNIFQNLALSCLLLWWAREKSPVARSSSAGVVRLPSYRLR